MSILASASTVVIAELGVNHDGSVTRALELVDFVDEPTRLPQALIVLKHR